VVIAGWLTGSMDMQSFIPGFVTMKVNTACGLAAASDSSEMQWRAAR